MATRVTFWLKGILGGVLALFSLQVSAQDVGLDELALYASEAVYAVPEAGYRQRGTEALAAAGYHAQRTVSHHSGLRARIYMPSEESDAPIIVSFAGTESRRDALANLGLGFNQIHNPKFKALLDQVFDLSLKTNRPILATGHSLGGGLAQYFSFFLNRRLNQVKRTPENRVAAITWNSFGGLDLLEHLGFDIKNVEKEILIKHYRIRKDPVSFYCGGLHCAEMILPWDRELGNPHGIAQFLNYLKLRGSFSEVTASEEVRRLRLPNWFHAVSIRASRALARSTRSGAAGGGAIRIFCREFLSLERGVDFRSRF